MKFFVILISIFLLSILVFNSIKIKIEFFQCSNPTKYPNCQYERDVNILYLNPPTPDTTSTYATINPITGIQPGKQIKYNCDNVSGNCLYNLIPN